MLSRKHHKEKDVETIKAKIEELTALVQKFNGWDSESPALKEIEFDGVLKLVVVQDEGFETIKIHRRK